MSELYLGDCLDVLKTLPDNSVDSVVTDPPYGLRFMNRHWDYDVPTQAVWQEVLRVLKPGGHVLSFAGSRTYHRMVVAIEDAGFEVRDQLMWVYGSGFPKSLDVSKAIDKVNGETGRRYKFTDWMRATGLTAAQINAATGTFMGSHYLTDKSQPAIPTPELWASLRPLCGEISPWVDELVDRIAAEREIVGFQKRGQAVNTDFMSGGNDITAPATEAAQRWAGWGTALKPAHEPICLARKPLIGTVAENVMAHGTGALNIDVSRIPATDKAWGSGNRDSWRETEGREDRQSSRYGEPDKSPSARWPANLIHDGSDEVVGLFPKTGPSKAAPRGGTNPNPMDWGNGRADGLIVKGHNDQGGTAARFFYCAKASRSDRGADNRHPTVKPTDLMRYLCRLITPPGGTVLDPFMGSGSTGKAAILEGFDFIGIEREAEYLEIARARIAAIEQPAQMKMAV